MAKQKKKCSRHAGAKPSRKTSVVAAAPAAARRGPADHERQRMIAEAAYFRAAERGFAGGDPLQDWVEAETEIAVRVGMTRALRDHGHPERPA